MFCRVINLYIEDFKEGQVELTYSVARQLGYTAEGYLVEYRDCWEIFSTNCGIFIHFTTNLTREELQDLISQITPTQQHSSSVSLFNDINMNTNRTLTVERNDNRSSEGSSKHPLAHGWYFFDKQGRNWKVIFFNLVEQPYQYKIDDQPISGNIIRVMLKTK